MAGAALAAAQNPPAAKPQIQVNPQPLPPQTRPGVQPGRNLPDITNLKKGIIIGGAVGGAGGKFVPWGTTVDLSDVDPLPGTYVAGGPAAVALPGRCAFNVTYDESNIGTAATSPLYTNRLKLIGPTEVAVNSGQHLNAGQTETVTTQPYLTEGSNALMLYLDDGNAVTESNEGNNFFSIKYTLKCKATPGNPNNPNGNPTGGPNKLPDITSAKGGIIIGGAVGGAGGKFVPWGGVADLSSLDPLPGTVVGERCAFNVTYYETNIGSADTSPLYTNKLKVDGATDVSINSARHLNAGEVKQVDTQAYLTMGGHGLELSLDDLHQVTESNEGNNMFSIRYTLQCHKPPVTVGNCDGLPDLVPILPNPMNGTVMVKNIGKCPAGPSKLTLTCAKAGIPAGTRGGCPEVPATVSAPYMDPMFPDSVTVNVPALAAGASFSHTLSFWAGLTWTTGTYAFVGKADAANTVAESNEANNVVNSALVVP
jgi:hypothetical protein